MASNVYLYVGTTVVLQMKSRFHKTHLLKNVQSQKDVYICETN